jgi:hypothetical protein
VSGANINASIFNNSFTHLSHFFNNALGFFSISFNIFFQASLTLDGMLSIKFLTFLIASHGQDVTQLNLSFIKFWKFQNPCLELLAALSFTHCLAISIKLA